MKKFRLKKIAGFALTVFIIIQACVCVVLMLRSVSGRDMEIFGYRFYHIISPSMEPTIPVGSQIIVKETDPAQLQVGDIITFRSQDPAISGYPNTHRIDQIVTDDAGNTAYITKGDNNPIVDDYLVYPADLYGKVVVITPVGEWLLAFYSFATTPIGFCVVIIMPLLLVLAIFLRSFIKEIKRLTASPKEEAAAPAAVTDALVVEAVVQAYLSEHPHEELTAEEATAIAGELMTVVEATRKEGVEE